ncbi:MAG: PIN domain-containing protein [Salinibacterium sp.]|nr:PIN domain-containing protein [Salinibacterium sp.]
MIESAAHPVFLDTSVLIDFLRGRHEAIRVIGALVVPPLSSEICRVELLQGLRESEHADAAALASLIEWIPVVEPISIRAGELGRRWRPSHSGIGAADLIIASTAELTGASFLTLDVRHFPMFKRLQPAY